MSNKSQSSRLGFSDFFFSPGYSVYFLKVPYLIKMVTGSPVTNIEMT